MAEDRDGPSRREVVAGAAGMAIGLHPAPAGAGEAGPRKIMIVRHAEKPTPDGAAPFGLGRDGRHDVAALLVRGWQRAGALARFFVPREGASALPDISPPTFLVAAAPTRSHPSRRAGLTLAPWPSLRVSSRTRLSARIRRARPRPPSCAAAAWVSSPGSTSASSTSSPP